MHIVYFSKSHLFDCSINTVIINLYGLQYLMIFIYCQRMRLNKTFLHFMATFTNPSLKLSFTTLKNKHIRPLFSSPSIIKYSFTSTKNKDHQQLEQFYSQYGWGKQYEKKFSQIISRKENELDRTRLLQLYVDTARKSFNQDDPKLNSLLFQLGEAKQNIQDNFGSLRIFKEIDRNFQKHPHLKKTSRLTYYEFAIRMAEIQLSSFHNFQDSLQILKKLKGSFEQFDMENHPVYIQAQVDFYISQGSKNIEQKKFKEAIESFKKSTEFAKKADADKTFKMCTMKSLRNYIKPEFLYGDRHLSLEAAQQICQIFNFHENFDFIHRNRLFCHWYQISNTFEELQFGELAVKKMKEFIQVVEEKKLIRSYDYHNAINWLIAYYTNKKLYKQALPFFETLLKARQHVSNSSSFQKHLIIQLLIRNANIQLCAGNYQQSYNIICKTLIKIKLLQEGASTNMNIVLWSTLSDFKKVLQNQNEEAKSRITPALDNLKKELQLKIGRQMTKDEIQKYNMYMSANR